jgi:hypothetical protein
VVVEVLLVQPGWPLEQLPTDELNSEMLQSSPDPQVPGQDAPQAVGALLKNPPTLEVEGQALPGG